MISLASAAYNFDNTYEYFPEVNTAVIHNCDIWIGWCWNEGEVLAEVTLTSGNTIVPKGDGILVGEFNLTTTGDFEDIFGEMYLTDMKNGNEISRGKQYKYKKYTNVSVDDYETVCDDETGTAENLASCVKTEVGSHIELQMDWIPINNPTNTFLSDVTYEIGVFVDVEEGDWGDWRPKILGVWIPEFSEWTQSLNTNLEGYWKLNNNDLTDSLGVFDFTNDGTTNITGIIESGRDFSSDNMKIGDIGLNTFTGLTYSLWFYPESYPSDAGILGQLSGQLSSGFNSNTAQVYFWLDDDGGWGPDLLISTQKENMVLNQWNHLVGTWDGTTAKFYVNGILRNSGAYSTSLFDSNEIYLGLYDTLGTRHSDGRMDELAIYSRALDDDGCSTDETCGGEIEQMYNGGSAVTWTDQFGIPPSVTLTSPANDSNLTSSLVEFIITATDDQQIVNVSLFIDGILNETNSSGFNGTYTFNKIMAEGIHNWSILVFDNDSASNQSETRIFNFTQPPINIQLIEPTDAFTSNIPTINMSCNASDPLGVEQLNLTINGIVNETITNSTTAENLTIIKEINFSEGIYIWGCQAFNLMNTAASANRTLNVTYSSPVVTLTSPDDGSNTTEEEVSFSFTATDVNGMDNVSLYINEILNETDTTGVNGSYVFQKTLEEGFYNWSVIANSILSKETISAVNNFIVHLTEPNATILAPSGEEGYFLLGSNETLSYSFTEAGQNLSEHLEECWYEYPITDLDTCYQESATVTNQTGIDGDCDLNYSGNYLDDTTFLYMNYTKPVGARPNSKWRVKYGINNTGCSTGGTADRFDPRIFSLDIDIPQQCFSQSILQLRFFTNTNGATSYGSCFNGNSWQIITPISQTISCFAGGGSQPTAINSRDGSWISFAGWDPFNGAVYRTVVTDLSGVLWEEAMLWKFGTDLNCTANETSFTYIEDQNNISIFAQDTFGFIATNTSTWEYGLLEIDQTFNNQTVEGTTETFILNASIPINYTISSVKFNYNDVGTDGSPIQTTPNTYIMTKEQLVPGVAVNTNITFFWNITFTNGINLVTNNRTQLVQNNGIDNCSNFTNMLFNFTVVDEKTQLVLNGPADNVTVKVDFSFNNPDSLQEILNISEEFTNQNPIAICMEGELGSSVFSLDATIEYESSNRFVEFYNLQAYNLSSDSDEQNITLYNLREDEGQAYKITYKGQDFIPVENLIINIQRKYIEEGVFKTIEIPMSGSSGETIAHLVSNNVIYNLIFIKDGVVLDSFTDVIASCQNPTISECEINLNALITGNDLFGLIEESDFFSSLSYDKSTSTVSSTFGIPSGVSGIVTLDVTLVDNFGNTTVCSDLLAAAGGTLDCVVPSSFGNATVYAKLLLNGEIKREGFMAVNELPSSRYKGILIFSSVILLLFIFGIGVSDHPGLTGIFFIIGALLLLGLNLFYSTSWIGAGATILWFVVAVILVIVKGGSKR